MIVRWLEWVCGVFSTIWIWSRECLFYELDCSLRLLDKVATLLGVYKLLNLAIGDCSSDSSSILIFVCKNYVILAESQHIDGSTRWLTSFNSNHIFIYLFTILLYSVLHCTLCMQLLYLLLTHSTVAALCSRGRNILFVVKKSHRLCCHQKLANKIQPTILGVNNRLLEESWGWIWRQPYEILQRKIAWF